MLNEKTLVPPRQIKTKETKDKILNAALRIMKKYGYEYLTVRNICEAAGVSNGTFYHHFANKDDLLAQYIMKSYHQYLTSLDSSKTPKSFKDKIINAYVYYVRFLQESGIEFMSNYYSTKNKSLNSRHNKTERVLFTISELEKAQQEGLVSNEISAEQMGIEICMLCQGVIFNWCIADGGFDFETTISRILSIYFSSIVTDKYKEIYQDL
ncbi:MAG: TetR/AcrR family transcriptional regulator [Syntrophomonadaceae bacterium]